MKYWQKICGIFGIISFIISAWILPHSAGATPNKTLPEDKTMTLGVEPKQAESEPVIRVGLATGQEAAVFSSPGDYVVRDGTNGQGLEKLDGNTQLTVTMSGRQFVLNGKPVSAKTLVIKTPNPRSAFILSYNGANYRGDFSLIIDDGAITVINNVKLDDYVAGVLGAEMGSEWPPQALRAQAVAARTFALYSLGRHEKDGFNVCNDTHCQVYGGISTESKAALTAVSATRGEVMMYDGKPIYAAFHASAGGWTAGNEEVGGDPVPYLKPVQDKATYAAAYHWQLTFLPTEVRAALREYGSDIGNLKRVELSPLDEERRTETPDRYWSGRVRRVRFVGTLQTVDIPGPKLRWIFGLPGTRFDIRYKNGSTDGPNRNGKIEFKGKSSEALLFDGWGRGHGLGLSQWGAYAMAAKNDYRTILHHYYTNIEIIKLY